MDVYRINKEPYHTDPRSVIGSERYGGRWNPQGLGVLYTSRSPELSLLETIVHLPAISLAEIPRLWLSTLRLPEKPESILWIKASELPDYWKTGTLAETRSILSEWLLDPFCLGVAVPSVIIEQSYNILLHPAHPDFEEIELISQIQIPFDRRLVK